MTQFELKKLECSPKKSFNDDPTYPFAVEVNLRCLVRTLIRTLRIVLFRIGFEEKDFGNLILNEMIPTVLAILVAFPVINKNVTLGCVELY